MEIRCYEERDLEALRAMHAASGFAYNFPELLDWRMNPVLVVEKEGRAVAGAALRLTSEAYLWMEKVGKPEERWQALLGLHEEVRREAERIGYEDVHAFLPPGLPKGFERRLGKLGWVPEKFRCYWRRTAAEN